jgi:hypothetical protein
MVSAKKWTMGKVGWPVTPAFPSPQPSPRVGAREYCPSLCARSIPGRFTFHISRFTLLTLHVWMSFLCVRMLIRMPNPRQIVTREVPP